MENKNPTTITYRIPWDLDQRVETERKRRTDRSGCPVTKHGILNALITERLDHLEGSIRAGREI